MSVREMGELLYSLGQIAREQRKCLACHCYREVAWEALSSAELIGRHGTLGEAGAAGEVAAAMSPVRHLLESSEGTHG